MNMTPYKTTQRCTTRLFAVAAPTTDLSKLKQLLTTLIAAGGIVVQIEVLHMDPEEAPRFHGNTTIRRVSKDQLLDIGIPPPPDAEVKKGSCERHMQK
jgi:hypothetical protein